MRISDWSSDVCSSDLLLRSAAGCCQQRGYVASRGLRYALAFWAIQSACSLHVARRSAMKPRLLVLVAIVAFVAAVAGVFLGRHFLPHPVAGGVELHDVLHSKLDLDDPQQAQLDLLEQRFAVSRRANRQ